MCRGISDLPIVRATLGATVPRCQRLHFLWLIKRTFCMVVSQLFLSPNSDQLQLTIMRTATYLFLAALAASQALALTLPERPQRSEVRRSSTLHDPDHVSSLEQIADKCTKSLPGTKSMWIGSSIRVFDSRHDTLVGYLTALPGANNASQCAPSYAQCMFSG